MNCINFIRNFKLQSHNLLLIDIYALELIFTEIVLDEETYIETKGPSQWSWYGFEGISFPVMGMKEVVVRLCSGKN